MGKRIKQREEGLSPKNFKKKNSEPIKAHLKVKQSIKYDSIGIILNNFLYLQKECFSISVFIEDIPGIGVIKKAL